MKNKFSKAWKSSKKPRKQRKYVYNSPLNIKGKMLSSHLSKELIKKYGKRNLRIRKGDTAKVVRGQFKGKIAKVEKVLLKKNKVLLQDVQVLKLDGSKAYYPTHTSNLIITELNLEDKKRLKSLTRK